MIGLRLVAVLVALLLVGCGGPSGGTRRDEGAPRTLRGTVTEGVEQGCLLLASPDGDYLLVGGDRSVLRPGSQVVVTGVVEPDLLTTCQQGMPLRVVSAERA